MKKILLFAMVGALLSGCANDEFNDNDAVKTGSEEISFSMKTPNITRGTSDDAAKLGNKFIVYGWKATSPVQVVFDNYSINWTEANKGTTKTNTVGWEYVGYYNEPISESEEAVKQDVKYWDYSAPKYDFLAWRILDGSLATIESITEYADKAPERKEGTTENFYNAKMLKFLAPSSEDLGKVFISNQNTVVKNDYQKDVEMHFRNLGAKVRLGIYETVPGYSVKDVKFYQVENGTSSNTPALYVSADSKTDIPTSGSILVKYQASDNQAVAKTTATTSLKIFINGNGMSYNAAPENKEEATNFYVGRTSNTASYPSTGVDGGYTYAFPHDTLSLNLKVDYTLVAIDGKGETIKVKGATASVPAQYGQWKANYAYTYLFKISDKSNGTTGNPDDPSDPKGLYPITFDAVVVSDGETGTQETITSVDSLSITTYQSGKVVTENDEYNAGDIFFNVMENSTIKTLDKTKVFEVVYDGSASLTESLIEDYAKGNGVNLIEVATGETTSLTMSDGTTQTFAAKTCKYFNAKAGKKYAIAYNFGETDVTYKLVRVTGTDAGHSYTTYYAGSGQPEIQEPENVATFYVKDGTQPIYGAAKYIKITKGGSDVTSNFTIAELTDGKYTFTLKDEVFKAGTANGEYVVTYKDFGNSENKNKFTVNITYTLKYVDTDTKATVIANATTYTVSLTYGTSSALSGAKIINSIAGVSVADNNNGTYTISADASATKGDYTFTLAGKEVKVKVITYELASSYSTIVWRQGEAVPTGKFATLSSDDGTVKQISIKSSNTNIIKEGKTDDAGKFTFDIPSDCKGGTTTLSYANAKKDITVNKYELTVNNSTIIKSTGSSILTLKCNGSEINASSAKITVWKDNSGWVKQTTGFTLTTSGKYVKLSNVTLAAGSYQIRYTDTSISNDGPIGKLTITVNN